MKHGSLFTGIGGFDLAAEWAGIENVWQVQYDPKSKSHDKYLIDLLKKNFPNARQISKDIAKVKGEELGYVDIISGGDPCQPYSYAGKRKGKDDDRALWDEMLRIIQETKPPWIINENVAGSIDLVFDKKISDLEAAGYETETFIIPACGTNAPHKRHRPFIIAYSDRNRELAGRKEIHRTDEKISKWHSDTKCNDSTGFDREIIINTQNSARIGRGGRNNGNQRRQEWALQIAGYNPFPDGLITDINNNGFKEQQQSRISPKNKKGKFQGFTGECRDWNSNWLKIATELCRVDDGVSQKFHRVDRIKGLGNAIVPQIAYIIFSFIKQINDQLA